MARESSARGDAARAALIAAPHAVEVVTDDRLIESNTTLEGAGKTLWSFLRSPHHWWSLRNPWKPTWGETFSEIRARMVEAVSEAVEQAEGKEVVVVSHQTPIQVAAIQARCFEIAGALADGALAFALLIALQYVANGRAVGDYAAGTSMNERAPTGMQQQVTQLLPSHRAVRHLAQEHQRRKGDDVLPLLLDQMDDHRHGDRREPGQEEGGQERHVTGPSSASRASTGS